MLLFSIYVTPFIGQYDLTYPCQLQLQDPKVLGSIVVPFVAGFLSQQTFWKHIRELITARTARPLQAWDKKQLILPHCCKASSLAPRICGSIAPDDANSLLKNADRAFAFGADYVEIRFDFVNPDLLPEALQAAKRVKDRAIFTMRSKIQGGVFARSERDRLQWLYRLAEEEPMLLDVELDTLQKNDDLADFLERKRSPLLVSWHDFEKTPPRDSISDILSEMRTYSNYVKIVTTAHSVDDSMRLLELYETAIGLSPIFFAMGDAGVLSRLLCTIIGNAPFTYASVDKALAPGQFNVQQMKKLYDKISAGSKI